MLNAIARVADNTNVVANIAALVPQYNPKKEAVRKMTQVQTSHQSNKSTISGKDEKDSVPAVRHKSKDSNETHTLNPNIDFIA
ncbi:MAG: hypothetical protein FJ264_01900 [Planctomycetes bacterium]|nr:hypothetical protein [Planctomycetota bacterium]